MKKFIVIITLLSSFLLSKAQNTADSIQTVNNYVAHYYKTTPKDIGTFYKNKQRGVIFVNAAITTHLIMPEPITTVDISTDTIVGNTETENILRIKPKTAMQDNEIAGTITIVGERNIVFYDVVYCKNASEATPLFYIPQSDLHNYLNPEISMSQNEMYRYAWAIYSSKRKFNNITAKSYGCKMVVNNIYTIGDYFFIDFSLYNKSNIKYTIDELRIKLTDKKQTKATTSQTIELTPAFILNTKNTFKHAYRNVVVLNKLTFPDEKILKIEIYEKQISGRSITIPIAYEDILHADGASEELMKSLQHLK